MRENQIQTWHATACWVFIAKCNAYRLSVKSFIDSNASQSVLVQPLCRSVLSVSIFIA